MYSSGSSCVNPSLSWEPAQLAYRNPHFYISEVKGKSLMISFNGKRLRLSVSYNFYKAINYKQESNVPEDVSSCIPQVANSGLSQYLGCMERTSALSQNKLLKKNKPF